MQSHGLSGVALWSALVIGGLTGCGGGDESTTADSAESADRVAAAEPAAESLTAAEQALLAEFRASREAKAKAEVEVKASAPTSTPPPAPTKAGPGVARPSGPPAMRSEAAAKPPSSPPSSSASPTVFVQHPITDPHYNGMVATTVLYPESWKVEGGITRLPPAYYNVAFLNDIKFMAPDGRQAHFFPAMSFEFGGQGQGPGQGQTPPLFSPTGSGNMYYPLPETPGQWLMQLAKADPDPTVSNLQLVSEEPEPDLTQQLQQQSAQVYRMIQDSKPMAMQTGVDSAFDTQATVITLRYTQNDIELEESVLVAWQYFINLWNGQVTGGTWGVPMMVSVRGPVGTNYLFDPELMAIFHSVRPNPQWLQKQQAYWNELARIRSKGAADRNRDWQKHNAKMQQINNETNAIIVGGHAQRTAMRDAGHAKQMDSVMEVTPYQLPSGETVKIPDYYDNVHTDGNGRFILSNDLNYNPDRDLNLSGSWTQIQPQR